jgi:hypothetical protein
MGIDAMELPDRLELAIVDDQRREIITPKRKPPAVPGDSQSLTVPGVGRKTPSGEPLNVQPRGS